MKPGDEILPVHCCCEPGRRLGYVPVGRLPLGVVMFPVRTPEGLRVIRTEIAEIRTIRTTTEVFSQVSGEITSTVTSVVAVKSAHEPIEVWRLVPGFLEEV